jgi:CheY-like chemotaxis protein/two-component sensor histidine kinase
VPTDVAELARGMIDLISSTIGSRIELTFDHEADLPAALNDPNQLEMALLNLSVNARDAMSDGGTLRILVEHALVQRNASDALVPGDYVRLRVADTGIGLDDETKRRAVEPFFSTKGVGQGTGLGLSMAHGLAAQLGGALTIDSAPGRGTEISLWLPATALPSRSVPPVQQARPKLAGGTALLVDDEEAVRQSTAQMLVDLGYTVTTAPSGTDAWALITQGSCPWPAGHRSRHAGHDRHRTCAYDAAALPRAAHSAHLRLCRGSRDRPQSTKMTKPFMQALRWRWDKAGSSGKCHQSRAQRCPTDECAVLQRTTPDHRRSRHVLECR